MFEVKIDKYRFAEKNSFRIDRFDTSDKGNFEDREDAISEFVENLKEINKLQQKLYAERKEGVIFIFQAMDAAGKDGVIRTVFSTLTPHGVKEYCFKVPSAEEASHDFLWRFWSALPARGHISIFNRSYYEDVLVGKVRKLYLNQNVPERVKDSDIIKQRYGQIKDFENYLYRTGTRVVKIFLHVSKEEQARRFVSRIDSKKKNWKISANDIAERDLWDEYMEAFESMINQTSTKDSPWYVVPSDRKWYARLVVSKIVLDTLREMDPQYPELDDEELELLEELRKELIRDIPEDTLQDEDPDTVFTDASSVSADICEEDEMSKVKQKKKKIKESGFDAISRMIAKGYIAKSTDDIISAVAGTDETKRYEPKIKAFDDNDDF